MDDYDIHIRADVVGSLIVIGTQLNVYDLSKERHFLRFRNAVTLKVCLSGKYLYFLFYSFVNCTAYIALLLLIRQI